jgi:type III restriction enzyme
MKFKLEDLDYQRKAIDSVVRIFQGQNKNNYNNSTFEGIRKNVLDIPLETIKENVKSIISDNSIDEKIANLSDDIDFCIEMETGTGKTLVYIKTIFELYKEYGFTKFIIVVPSVPIKQGVLKSFEYFSSQLENIYNVKPTFFVYDSKSLSPVRHFIENQELQIMIMTLQSFNNEGIIKNREEGEKLFENRSYSDGISETRPVLILDEPQVSMDTDVSLEAFRKLNPLCKSAIAQLTGS